MYKEWKRVPNQPKFEVNSHGDIREAEDNWVAGPLPMMERVVDEDENVYVLFGSGGTTKKAHPENQSRFRLDRIVAAAFLNTTPRDLMSGRQLIHLDGDPENCNADNLMWEEETA